MQCIGIIDAARKEKKKTKCPLENDIHLIYQLSIDVLDFIYL
jgi:hypothetical protein